jgi:soluble lytic murein transglycosylase-like protein
MMTGYGTRNAERGTLKPYVFIGATSASRMILFLLVLMLSAIPAQADNPWMQLQDFYGSGSSEEPDAVIKEAPRRPATRSRVVAQDDPWSILQNFYVPFTQEEEVAASSNPSVRRKVAGQLHDKLAPYQSIINDAAKRFDIPPAVIGAVIMVESSGNPKARAKTSSAKGLMQTIKTTFAEARAGLKTKGIQIPNDPYSPKASIMAGSWYLDHMFRQMERDNDHRFDRNDLAAWRKVAEYYYAGPNHGRKRAGVVIMYAGGKRVVVDKAGYAQKVMKWARVMG